jgi:cell division protein FtsW
MKTATTLLLVSILGLLALSITMLVSSSTLDSNTRYLAQQPLWCGVGLVAFGLAAASDYRWLKKYPWLPMAILGLAVILLVLVLIPHLGIKTKGARRWIGMGGLRFQPSEFAKLALIIGLAWYGERFQRQMPSFVRGMVIPLGIVGAVMLLVFAEPDVGTALLLGAISSVMLLVAGMRFRYFLPPVLVAMTALVVFIANNPMRSERIYSWLHLEETKLGKGMQVYRARVAIGSGGVEGRGPGESRMKLEYLPEHHTDFILAIIGEELGVAGSLGLVAVYLAILICGAYIAWHASDVFGMLMATGITFLIGLQAFINIAVVTNTFPNKGLALPFVSYGGSSLVALLMCVGFLISIGRHAGSGLSLASGFFGRRNPFHGHASAESI